MQTIRAIYDGINFRPMQPIPVKENMRFLSLLLNP